MEFLQTIKESIYSPAFYSELKKERFSFSLKYFYLLAFVLGFCSTVVISYNLIPAVQSFLKSTAMEILNLYPNDLVITIKDGTVSTNVSEPYVLKMPEELHKSNNEPRFENLLVIDTGTPFTLEEFRAVKTALLLTKDSIVYSENGGKITIQSIQNFPNTVIDKPFIVNLVGKIEPFLKFVPPIIVAGTFLFFLASFSWRLIYLLLGAFLIWGIAKVKKAEIGYRKSYQIGLHAMTLGLFVDFLVSIASIPFHIPFFFTILMLATVFFNLEPAPKNSGSASEASV